MTKYEELCGVFGRSTNDWNTYHERAILFVAKLLTGFVSYLGAPNDRVEFLPPEPRDSSMTYSPMGAAKLNEDGWWVAYARLTLALGDGVYPQRQVLFQFRARVEPDKCTVRIGDSERRHTITDGDDAAEEAVYQEACELATDYFTSGLHRFFDETQKDDSRKIGFA